MQRRTGIEDRQTFTVADGHLLRTVRSRNGRTYTHRCSLEAFKEVAWFVQEHGASGVTTQMVWDGLPQVACSRTAVALAFLKERGCLEVRYRRSYPASEFLYEDALIEFHALEAKGA